MRLTVTGCNGRLGTRVVVNALAAGWQVLGIDNGKSAEGQEYENHPRFSFLSIDLTDYEKTLDALKGSQAIVHLAAIPTPEDYAFKTHNTNVVLSWNILRAAAELGITRVAQASSVNVVTLVWSQKPKLCYLPLDEEHPCEPDEPYGLSKVIAELQADTIVRRYSFMRVASLRPSWTLPSRDEATKQDPDPDRRKNDLWGWVHHDAVAQAFLKAVSLEEGTWKGHEAFFITADTITSDKSALELWEKYWKPEGVPIKPGKDLSKGFFDCSKAERLLGWVHTGF